MSELVIVIGVISSGIVAVITAVFTNMRKSRCTTITCCGLKCDRDVPQESRKRSVEKSCSAFAVI